MKYSLLLLISILFFVSCEEKTDENKEEVRTEATEEQAEMEFAKFGKEITPDGAIDAKDIVSKLETLDSLQIKLSSTVNAVCKKKGCWMTIPVTEDMDMRVRFKDYEYFVPKNCEGKNVIIEGWAYKTITPISELKHYALDGGASIEEIDAITEPEVGYTFMADGVLMN